MIRPYDYDPATNAHDDFKFVAGKMLAVDNIVFATPVYWYSMSECMKAFFDRLTDLLSFHKIIGKGLKGIHVPYCFRFGSRVTARV